MKLLDWFFDSASVYIWAVGGTKKLLFAGKFLSEGREMLPDVSCVHVFKNFFFFKKRGLQNSFCDRFRGVGVELAL